MNNTSLLAVVVILLLGICAVLTIHSQDQSFDLLTDSGIAVEFDTDSASMQSAVQNN